MVPGPGNEGSIKAGSEPYRGDGTPPCSHLYVIFKPKRVD